MYFNWLAALSTARRKLALDYALPLVHLRTLHRVTEECFGGDLLIALGLPRDLFLLYFAAILEGEEETYRIAQALRMLDERRRPEPTGRGAYPLIFLEH